VLIWQGSSSGRASYSQDEFSNLRPALLNQTPTHLEKTKKQVVPGTGRTVSIILQALIMGICLSSLFTLNRITSVQNQKDETIELTGQKVGKRLSNGATVEVERQKNEAVEDWTARFLEAIRVAREGDE